MRIDADQLASLGEIADTIDNLSHATKIALPAEAHLEALRPALEELCDRLRRLYVAVSGQNPWKHRPSRDVGTN